MKLLKELFSFDEHNRNTNPLGDNDNDEFDFDFDFDSDNTDDDDDLDFDNKDYSDSMGVMDDDGEYTSDESNFRSDDDMGSEEDYPESMIDMPHDDYENDGDGGMISDDDDGAPGTQEEELSSIKAEIKSLFARLGTLAAAGDLNLFDDTANTGDVSDLDYESDGEFENDEMGVDAPTGEFDAGTDDEFGPEPNAQKQPIPNPERF